ncbi:conserved hypothetical protein [Paraburkholderia piptadeniae]|uniref:DUF1488 domain-containing protein n=2 Tax=Paraburkholderia piptadeniae TaxID=1701573 RepID=A0A1N7S9B0_9BURK|nr:conserved hypothetical protein [Paraburkholderia piptadeniae]
MTMDDVLTAEPCVYSEGKMVVFVASVRNHSMQCSIARAALEQHFWLPPNADNRRMLKAFADGKSRIVAVAERRMLKAPGTPIALTAADFC